LKNRNNIIEIKIIFNVVTLINTFYSYFFAVFFPNRVGKNLVNIPSFMVKTDSEKSIDHASTSPLGGGREGRTKRKNAKKNWFMCFISYLNNHALIDTLNICFICSFLAIFYLNPSLNDQSTCSICLFVAFLTMKKYKVYNNIMKRNKDIRKSCLICDF